MSDVPSHSDTYFKFVVTNHASIEGPKSPIGSLIHQFERGCYFQDVSFSSQHPLKWAILAWAARQYPPGVVPNSMSYYSSRAVRYLNIWIRSGRCHELEAFAANLLGWVAYSVCSQEIDSQVHFKGSLAILISLLDRASPSEPVSSGLMLYGPFIIDCANAWAVRNGVVPRRSTNFLQRVRYFDDLSRGPKSGIWYSGILEAANSTLGNLLEISLTCSCQLARRGVDYNFTRDPLNETLQYIRAELGDVDFHAALRAIHASFQGANTNHTTVEGQLITRLFHRLRAVLLLHSILDNDTIQKGVVSERSVMFGTGLISACRNQAIRRDGPIDDYYLISWHNYSLLLLGGMTLSTEESPERKLVR